MVLDSRRLIDIYNSRRRHAVPSSSSFFEDLNGRWTTSGISKAGSVAEGPEEKVFYDDDECGLSGTDDVG
jgi:hypothetical protein